MVDQRQILRDVLDKKIAIIGSSSFAKEVYSHLLSDLSIDLINKTTVNFYVDDQYINNSNNIAHSINVKPISEIDIENSLVIVAIGDSKDRYNVVNRLSKDIDYFTFIHSSGKILLKDSVKIGNGSIICAGTIITCDVEIGDHAHLNLNTTVGHDTVIGDFFTSAPGVNISGHCKIGNRVYIGTNASIKNKVSICDDVIVGMGACVVKDIKEPGTYVGVPVKRIKNA